MRILSSGAARRFVFFFFIFFMLFSIGVAQQPGPSQFAGLRWRMIGPFRGGRSIAVSGIESQPNTYYFGGVAGGVWKSTNSGETWQPIFDEQPIASIGALAVAPSDPNVIYAGTGEADWRSNLTYGNGVYKSTDGGKTWKNIGLRDSRHISRIIVDPRNAAIVLVAAMGHAYGPNPERGVFRSTDGGATWTKVLYRDDNTGAIDLAFDPDNPQTVFAALLNAHRPPWSTYPPITGSGAIYKSTDGGANWKPVTGGGLPEGDWGRVGLAVARGTGGRRIYALIDTLKGGLFRSDDGGTSWTLAGTDQRIRGRLWYFGEVDVDPKNPDTIYLPNVSIYRSTDAGKTFEAIKGAPGGDDYHSLWIDPSNPQRMIFGSDQGVGVSVDGGRTWSSWYNQPTAQFYHVAVDNQFPYRVYGAQQDSGTVSITSRGDLGSITFRDWYSVGAGESGYIAPDPTDPNIVYGGDTYGGLHRFDHRTGQSQVISPSALGNFGDISSAELRFTWTSPLVFSPQDPSVLYFGSQYVLRSNDRGLSWQRISPDLTGAVPGTPQEGPPTVQSAKSRGFGVVYTIAPSSLAGQIWAGADTGLIHLTRDGGKTWSNVTPSGLSDWSKISLIEASHFDAGTAYAAVDRHRLDDIAPYIYRTRDFGKTWTRISHGIPDGAYVRAVREDPVRKGLLFAGTELGVYVSLNDGDTWQPLQLNLPVAPVHDLVVKNNDLAAATHGRAFWILDDISPLRQMSSGVASGSAHLFKPATAVRVRANVNTDTPLPPEVPAGENPPAGAIIYYQLNAAAQGEVTLEILDSHKNVVRRYSSADRPSAPQSEHVPFPMYWFRPPLPPAKEPGLHRLVWDLRYTPPAIPQPGFSMATAFGQNTPTEPEGPLVLPGKYELKLTAGGQSLTAELEVVMDPRVKATPQDLQAQFALGRRIYTGLGQAGTAIGEIRELLKSGGDDAKLTKAAAIAGLSRSGEVPQQQPQQPQPSATPTLRRVTGALAHLMGVVDSADAAPTTQAFKAAEQQLQELQSLLTQWEGLKK